jgi:RNA-directed DNA polymerase
MRVSYGEDLANHIGPESCACSRKGAGEALTGESAGRVLSHEKGFASGCRRRQRARKATRNTSISREVSRPRVVVDPVHAWKLSAREPGDPVSGRSRWCCGPRCESRGSKTAMNGHRESDWPIHTKEADEQRRVRFLLTEIVEGRGRTKGRLFQRDKCWTQSQGGRGCEGLS